MGSKTSSGSQTNSSTSRTSLVNTNSTRVVSSEQYPQSLSTSTKLIGKQLRHAERDLRRYQEREQFLNGDLDWLMEQTMQMESSGTSILGRRGSLLTRRAVRVHNATENGRPCFVRESSDNSNNSELESGELTTAKTGSNSEARIDAWVSDQVPQISDPNR
jgi:hypothetical protein